MESGHKYLLNYVKIFLNKINYDSRIHFGIEEILVVYAIDGILQEIEHWRSIKCFGGQD
jgi:hypothetical protein